MVKLLQAGIRRYLTSPIFGIFAAASVIAGFYCGYQMALEQSFVTLYILIPLFICAIVLSLSIGREFGDGVIRNKIVSGHSKGTIFLSELFLGAGVSFCLFLLYFLPFMILSGYRFSRVPSTVSGKIILCFLLLHLSFTVIFVVVAMLISSKAIAPIVNMILIVAMFLFTQSVISDLNAPRYYTEWDQVFNQESGHWEVVKETHLNLDYVDGNKRKAYQWIVDVLPAGQADALTELIEDYRRSEQASELSEEQQRAPYRYPVCSLGLMVGLSGAGWFIFRKKELK